MRFPERTKHVEPTSTLSGRNGGNNDRRLEKRPCQARLALPLLPQQTITRSRLLKRLEALRSKKAVLVVASAGFGKTTLIAQWADILKNTGNDLVWMTLRSGQGSLPEFLAYILEALGSVGMQVSYPRLTVLSDAEERTVRELIGTLVNELAEHPRNVTLIIDEIQNLTDTRAQQMLRDLLEQSTDNFQVVLTGRFLPEIPLSRLRIMDQVAEVNSAELSFDERETSEFFRTRGALKLPPGQRQQAIEAVGGWPAGMKMLSLDAEENARCGASVDPLAAAARFREYVEENVLSTLDPDSVAFIRAIALLPRFCGSLAAVVSGCADAEARIREMERMQLFVSKLAVDGRYVWYRLHPLIAEALRPAQESIDPGTAQCHERAARWFAENGFLFEAVAHADATGGLVSLSELLATVPMSARSLSQLSSVRHLMDAIDPETLPSDSRLVPLGAWSFLLTGQLHQARRWSACIEPSQNAEFALHRRIIHAGIYSYQDDTNGLQGLIEGLDPFAIDHPFLRQTLVTEIISTQHAVGRFDDSDRTIANFIDRYKDERDEMALIVHAQKAAGLLFRGLAAKAEHHALKVLHEAEKYAGSSSVSAAVAASFAAEAQYELNRPEEARATLAGHLHKLQYASPDPLVRTVLTQAKIAACLIDPTAGTSILTDALPRLYVRGGDRTLAQLLQEQVRLELLKGRHDVVGCAIESMRELAQRNRGATGLLAEVAYLYAIAQARKCLDEDNPAEALKQLHAAHGQCVALNRFRVEIVVSLLKACAYARLDRFDDVLVSSQRAIDLCTPGRVVRPILDEGQEIVSVLLSCSDRLRIPSELLAVLRHACPAGADPTVPQLADHRLAQAPALRKLTPREREIVRLLAQSMSNKRIAMTLGISPATVKWNLQNIFQKLGATSRYEVIIWTRQHEAA